MYRIGISGWTYAGWRGKFYPKGLPHKRELEHASRAFNTIEINGSFYSLQRPESYRAWHDQTPEDFVFAVKGSRFITHMKKLKGLETALANFFASGVLCLGGKLGPILWQLPPNLGFDAGRMEAFFKLLPRTRSAAAKLARGHDERLNGRAAVKAIGRGALRHCVEVRHESFLVPEFFELLRRHQIAFVFADAAAKWPYAEDLTANFAYLRLHGAEELYASGYGKAALDRWARRIRAWSRGHQPRDAELILPRARQCREIEDVYVYFDNDAKVHAPFDAQELAKRLRR